MTDKQQEISSTTQKFLDIFDITNDVTVLRDGTVSMILMISAMNFGLLADQEQDSIIYSYAALLNSLNFPIQIVVNSKTKDATSYLRLLENQASKASSEDKRGRIKRYQNFVGQLIRERNVLDKKFYVIIPASPIEVGMLTPQSVVPGSQIPQLTQEQKAAVIEKGIGVLEPRRDHLISQFNRIGLYARPLATQEIIEIFYNNYNPEASEGQQITESQDYTSAMVNAGVVKPTERVIPALQPPSIEPLSEIPPIVQQSAQPLTQSLGQSLNQPTDQPIVATPRSPLKETTRSPVIIPKAPAMPPPAEL